MIIRFLILCLFLMALFLVPTSVFAASEGASGWGWIETIGRWVNLTILFGGLAYLLREPARKFFAERREGIQKEIREAKQAQLEAEEKLEAIKSRIENLDDDLKAIRVESEKEAEFERQRILEQADLEAERIVGRARLEIAGLTRTARNDLKEYAARLSVEIAEKQIRKDVDARVDRELMNRFLGNLEERSGK